jgi:hypothetical protein
MTLWQRVEAWLKPVLEWLEVLLDLIITLDSLD